jgi:hypothetical protein
MSKPTKQNAAGKGCARVDQAGGPDATGQTKFIDCSAKVITAVCQDLVNNGVGLRSASGDTQLATLPKALQYRGSRGLNTYEGTAAGYMRLATRVKELKDVWDIYTLPEDVIGPDGLLHKGVARYILLGKRKDMVPAQMALGLEAV